MVTGQRVQMGLFLKDLGIIFPAKVVKIFGHFFTILKNVNILAKTVGVTFGKIGLFLITTSGHTVNRVTEKLVCTSKGISIRTIQYFPPIVILSLFQVLYTVWLCAVH